MPEGIRYVRVRRRTQRAILVVGLLLLVAGLVWMFALPASESFGDVVLIGIPNWDGIWMVGAGLAVMAAIFARRKRSARTVAGNKG